MSTADRRERNRAVRIAYAHARAGRSSLVDAWLELAGRFGRPEAKQLEHAARLLLAGGRPIPGQLDLDGREHR